jgi:putative SOS response-associated peptidase YedK
MQPRYNIAPTQPVAAVRASSGANSREMALLRWGLIPFWAKNINMGARMINARSETVADKPAFRAAFRRRRCLVVADGFYEWQKVNGAKQPFYIHLQDGKAFGIAGLWERWEGAEGTAIESCTLLTTVPNELVRAVHDRMPVILAPEDYGLWLNPDIQSVEDLAPLLRPYPESEMLAYPVSRWVNSPRNNDPRCIEPLVDAEPRLPGL